MRLVVEDEDVLLPANLATQNAFDERCVAFHIAIARDARVLHVAVVVLLLVDHLNQPEGHLATVLLARQIPPPSRRRRLRAVVVFGPMWMISGTVSRRPAFTTRPLTPPDCDV